MTRGLFAAAGLAAALGLAGCGGDGGGDTPTTAPTTAATLRVAWSASPGALWNAPPNDTSPWAWTTATALIVPQTKALTSYATSDGAKQWTVQLPRTVCAIADAPNDAGIAAVLLSGGTAVNGEACGVVAAVDVNAGRLLWTRSLRGASTYGLTNVQVGPEAVAVTNGCDRAVTYSVDDGAPLAALPQREGDSCLHSFASDGRVVVDGDQRSDAEAIVGYDAVSGRRSWSVPVSAANDRRGALPTVERVISGSPLVIDASVNDHRFLFRVDPQAGTLAPFGREADDSFVPVFTQMVGDRVVVQYGRAPILFSYDPRSGAEVSHTVLADTESAFGVRNGMVITADAGGPTLQKAGLTVRSTDPETGDQQVLGTSSLDGVAATFGRGTGFDVALSGSTMVLRSADKLIAYRLPAHGPSAAELSGPSRVAPGELTPVKGVSLCTGITEATKQALGFADPTLAAPANCQWVEPVPGGGLRQLRVSAAALEPEGGLSGSARARQSIARLSRADTVNNVAPLTPLSGIGDQAASGTSTSPTLRLARVVARTGNVVIFVDATGTETGPRADELRLLQRGARLAAADVVAEVDRRR